MMDWTVRHALDWTGLACEDSWRDAEGEMKRERVGNEVSIVHCWRRDDWFRTRGRQLLNTYMQAVFTYAVQFHISGLQP